jgi:hypothetical protein
LLIICASHLALPTALLQKNRKTTGDMSLLNPYKWPELFILKLFNISVIEGISLDLKRLRNSSILEKMFQHIPLISQDKILGRPTERKYKISSNNSKKNP